MSEPIVTTSSRADTGVVSLSVRGQDGGGFVLLPAQTTPPDPMIAPTDTTIYANAANDLAWNRQGYANTLSATGQTGDRAWGLPDADGELLLTDNPAVISNKTILSADGNVVDVSSIGGFTITGVPSDGDVLAFNTVATELHPLTLSGLAPITYSSGIIGATVGQVANTLAAGNDPRFSTARVVVVKATGAGHGEFASISAAVGSISGASPTNQYVVRVNPGIYVEGSITLPDYVHLAGVDYAAVTLVASGPPAALISCTGTNWLSQIDLRGSAAPGSVGVSSVAASTTLWNCSISGFSVGVQCLSSGNVVVEKTMFSDCVIAAISATGPLQLGLGVYSCDLDGSAASAIYLSGPDTIAVIRDTQLQGDGVNTAITLEDGASLSADSCSLSSFDTGLHITAVGAPASLSAQACSLSGSTTWDILIDHAGAAASFAGVADKTKLSITTGCTFSCSVFDPVAPGVAASGDIYLAPPGTARFTNMSRPLSAQFPLGVLNGGSLSAGIGANVLVGAGLGYSMDQTAPAYIREITWGAQSLLVPGGISWVSVNSSGVATHAASAPDPTQQIILGRVSVLAGVIEFVDVDRAETSHNYNKYVDFTQRALGPSYCAGSQVSSNASRHIGVSSGQYFLANNYFTPSGLSLGGAFSQYYHTTSVWVSSPATVVTNTQYDDGANLVAIPAGKYIKHYLYLVGQGANEKYFLVIGQIVFDDLNTAQIAPGATPPAYFTGGVILLAGLVVQQGVSTVVDIIDLRPTNGATSVGASAGVSAHGDLTGLLGDDHPQYLLTNGGRTMTGALNMGSQPIISASTINGVTVESHASRHLPAGADPLATAAPLASLTSATSNQSGTANSFSRSDHSHSIDISGFSINSLLGPADVPHGGTGLATIPSGRFLVGAGTGPVTTVKVAPTGTVLGDTDAQTLSNKTATIAAGNSLEADTISGVAVSATLPAVGEVLLATGAVTAEWALIQDSSLGGIISVPHGGTGLASAASGRFLVGSGTSAMDATKVVPSGVVVGTTDVQTLTNKTATIAGGNSLEASSLDGVTPSGIPTASQVLVATSASSAQWTDITDAIITGVISVPRGGTGVATLTSGSFLVGAGTGPVTTVKVAPAGTVLGDTDTQTLSNKTATIAAGNSLEASSLDGVTPSGSPLAGQSLIADNSSGATWAYTTDSSLSGTILVPHGGTGQASLSAGYFLVGEGTDPVTTNKLAPSGVVVGTTDAQTLTNKSILSATNTVEATSLQTVAISATSPVVGSVLVATSGSTAHWAGVTDASLSGEVSVTHGGTGQNSLTTGRVLVGAGTSPVDISKPAPSGSFVGTTDSQTLTNKVILSAMNTVEATSLLLVELNTTPPSANQVLLATTPTDAEWSAIGDATITGEISVVHGGTGLATLPSGRFLVGAGAGPVNTAKVVPTGAVLGDTDTQTLSNKTATIAAGNSLEANAISGVTVSATLPTVGQSLIATSANTAEWAEPDINMLTGTLAVVSGGTGLAALTANRFLVGAGTSAVNLAKIVPVGAVLGDTDTQTLSNKTIALSGGNSVEATSLRTTVLDVAAPGVGQILVATSPSAASWVTPSGSLFPSPIGVPAGGTGHGSLTANRFLIGAGTSPIDATKLVPSGAVVGDSDTQILTNKTMTIAAGNTLEASSLDGVTPNGVPSAGNVLIASAPNSATWGTLSFSEISGTLPVSRGGTGSNILTSGTFLVGAGVGAVTTTVVVPSGAVVGDSDTQTLTNKTATIAGGNTLEASSLDGVTPSGSPIAGQVLVASSSSAASWSGLPVGSLVGTVPVASGGTGNAILTSGTFLVGAGTSAVVTTKVVPTGTVLGDTDTQTLSNKTMTIAAGNTVEASSLDGVTPTGIPAAGQVLVASSSSAAAWSLLGDSSITGVVSVVHGGTGASSLTAGTFLVGAGTGAVTTTKVVPTGAVLGDTDTQTLSNKTATISAGNSLEANAISGVAVSATLPSAGQFLRATSSAASDWSLVGDASITGTISVPHGGTGSSSLTSGAFLVGAGTSPVTATKAVPVGDVVGDSDTQTLTNKTATIAGGNTLEASSVQTVVVSAVAPSAGQILLASSGVAAAWGLLPASSVTGILPVPNGGTGLASLPAGKFLVGDGTNAVSTTKDAPTGAVLGDTDTQTISNKTMTVAAGNSIQASAVRDVLVSATSPSPNQILVASSSSAAAWGALPAGSISGIISVVNGGTGASTLTVGNFLVGAGVSAVATTKVAPTGTVLGDTDTQTLSNKTATVSAGNTLEASSVRTVVVDVTAPTAGQILVASSGTAAAWGSLPVGSISGILPVANGGTGASTLTVGNFLVGAGVGAVTTAKVAPAGVVLGTTDTQTITNKTMLSATNNLEARGIRTVIVSGVSPVAGQVLVASSPIAAAWGSLPVGSISGILPVVNGGTGASTLTIGNFLVGAGTGAVVATKVVPAGAVLGDTDTQTLSNKTATISAGNILEASSVRTVVVGVTAPTAGQILVASSGTAATWGSLPAGSISGILPVANGGTGASTLTLDNFLVGAGASAVTTAKVVPTGTVVGTTDIQTMTNKIIPYDLTSEIHATHITSVELIDALPPGPGLTQSLTRTSSNFGVWQVVTFASLAGNCSVAQGGTGQITLTAGNFLIGNGTSSVNMTKVAPAGVVVGTTDTQTLTNKTLTSATNTIEATSIRAVVVSATAPTTNQVLLATSATTAAWGSIPVGSISGILPVPNGGTGAATLTLGNFLVGAGTSAVTTGKVAPAGVVVGASDTQTLLNKTMLIADGNSVQADSVRTVVIGVSAPSSGQILVASSTTDAAWGSLPAGSISGIISVVNGGTGAATLTSGNFLVGAGASAVVTTKVAPAGTVVGTTDTQTISNKTMTIAAGNSVEASSLQTVVISGVAPTTNQILVASSGVAAAWGSLPAGSISGVISVANGGTGASILTSGNFLVGAGAGAVTTTVVAPSGIVVGDSDTQTLTNKTATIAGGNTLEASSVRTVVVGVTAPTAGQVLVASSGTAAAWGSLPVGSLSGILPVANGGTGAATLTAGTFLVGAGTSAVNTTMVVPSGTVVGTVDAQTLTNKTMTVAGGNAVQATSIRLVAVDVAAPAIDQILVATSATTTAWGSLPAGSISGIISVVNGGTGASTLTSGNFLVGAGVGSVTTGKVAPAGVVLGDTDTQTLSNKTMLAATNSVQATSIRLVAVSATAPTANQVLIASSGTAAAWGSVPVGSITGTLPVANGGTGVATLTSGNFLVGAGVGAVTSLKVVPAGVVVGTSDTQTLTSKTLLSATNTLEATSVRTVVVSATAPTANQVLIASSGTAAAWGSLPVGSISGTLPVANGGTGATTLTSGNFLVGNGAGAVSTTKVVPSGNVVGDGDTQTLTNKTMTAAGGNNVQATSLFSVQLDPFAPTAGQFLLTNNSTSALWTNFSASALTGILSVGNGGTGLSFLNNNRFLVGNGGAVVDLTKVIPTGTVVGDTDNQILQNKTLTVAGINTIEATSIRTVAVSAAAPTAGQVIVASSGTTAAWGLLPVGSISGTLPVANGGTGVATITSGNFLVGAGTSAVTSLKVAPAGVVVGTTDTQTLTNKTMLAATNSMQATSIQTTAVIATAPTTDQVLQYNGTQWVPAIFSLATRTWTFYDEKVSGTVGGSTAAATWTARAITNLVGAGTAVTRSGQLLLVSPGTYLISFTAPAYQVGFCRTRLFDTGLAAAIGYSSNAFSATTDLGQSAISFNLIFTATGSITLRIDQYAQNAKANIGLGNPTSIAGVPEIYLQGYIQQLS